MFAVTTRIVLLYLSCVNPLLAFQMRGSWNTARTAPASTLTSSSSSSSSPNVNKAVVEEDELIVGDLDDCRATPDSSQLYEALQDRLAEMEQGIGKRYVCRTQRGFLNIHKEPGDPYNTHNIVGQLREGDIVMSMGPNRGAWVRHDGGGWSISIFGGFTWLEELHD
uniref:SH3 domain-containing protein n=1 Tax=Amphora coffeiformis TaxID=265554 RepID=A0A7S3L334_9STRA